MQSADYTVEEMTSKYSRIPFGMHTKSLGSQTLLFKSFSPNGFPKQPKGITMEELQAKLTMVKWLIGGVLEGIGGKTQRQVIMQLQEILKYIDGEEGK